jgi:hypothetical protein
MAFPLRGKYEYLNLHQKSMIYACHACAIKGQTTMTSSFEAPYIIEFTVKSRQHGTSSMSLVQNRVRLKKHLQKSTLAFNRVSNSDMHHFLCQTEFDPVLTLSFLFYERFQLLLHIFSLLLHVQPQHFIPR